MKAVGLGRLVIVGAACAAFALAISAGSGSAAPGSGGGGGGTSIFAELQDNAGKIKGDVKQKGREGLFTLNDYDVSFSQLNGCSPLVMEMPYNRKWGRLTGDRGELFPIAKILVYETDNQGKQVVGMTYDFKSPVLQELSHKGAKSLTLTFSFETLEITQDGETEQIGCGGT
ncbi:MAG: hypothetical protein QOI31_887 [Solirubrobacterales bacterium]|jgi:type VI protein secretion system component Hcp|nr:hypothetical protein [Solirubrobacterales bacterium]